MATKRKAAGESVAPAGSVPLARVKGGFSRYVREVQTGGRSIIITQHGRPAAILAPVTSAARATLTVREPLDPRPLGALDLRPCRAGANNEAIRRALDEEREE